MRNKPRLRDEVPRQEHKSPGAGPWCLEAAAQDDAGGRGRTLLAIGGCVRLCLWRNGARGWHFQQDQTLNIMPLSVGNKKLIGGNTFVMLSLPRKQKQTHLSED